MDQVDQLVSKYVSCMCFFCHAEDGIRDAQESRGLGDVYKRQFHKGGLIDDIGQDRVFESVEAAVVALDPEVDIPLSLIHI